MAGDGGEVFPHAWGNCPFGDRYSNGWRKELYSGNHYNIHFRELYGSGFRIDESIYLANCAV